MISTLLLPPPFLKEIKASDLALRMCQAILITLWQKSMSTPAPSDFDSHLAWLRTRKSVNGARILLHSSFVDDRRIPSPDPQMYTVERKLIEPSPFSASIIGKASKDRSLDHTGDPGVCRTDGEMGKKVVSSEMYNAGQAFFAKPGTSPFDLPRGRMARPTEQEETPGPGSFDIEIAWKRMMEKNVVSGPTAKNKARLRDARIKLWKWRSRRNLL